MLPGFEGRLDLIVIRKMCKFLAFVQRTFADSVVRSLVANARFIADVGSTGGAIPTISDRFAISIEPSNSIRVASAGVVLHLPRIAIGSSMSLVGQR